METFSVWNAISFLKKYIIPYKKHFIAFYVGWLIQTVISVLLPKMFGIMLDEMIYKQNMDGFLKVSDVVVFLSVYSCILYYWLYAQHHYLMIMFTFKIKMDVFDKFFKIRPLKLKSINAGEVIALIQEYPAECMHFLIRGLIHQINNFIIMAAILIFSFKINALLGIFMSVLSVLCAAVTIIIGKKSKEASVRQRDIYGKYIGWLFEMIENFFTIRLLSAQNSVKQKYSKFSEKMFKEQNRMNMLQEVSQQLIKGIFLISEICIFIIAAFLTKRNMMTIGTFTVAMAYFNMLTSVIIDINQKWNDAQTRAGFVKKIKEFMEYPQENDYGKISLTDCKGKVSIRDLGFSYGKNTVYKNFNLTIEPGEKIAVVGVSGSGKSTLADLLTRFLIPNSGNILVDGVDSREYSLESFRKHIGILFQEALLFEGSLKDNILFGNIKATDEELRQAIENADLSEFVKSLPNGINTQIGEGHLELSGGQKQRVAIAQICLRNPQIIILDEPTSALDADTEDTIVETWEKNFKDKTVILITHRSKPLKVCSRIIQIGEK